MRRKSLKMTGRGGDSTEGGVPRSLVALFSIFLCLLIQCLQAGELWPDLSCHSPTFNSQLVKKTMESCMANAENSASVCEKCCIITKLDVLRHDRNKTFLKRQCPNARRSMVNLISDQAIAHKLLEVMVDKCNDIYWQFAYKVPPKTCEFWDPFVNCFQDALKC